MTSTQVLPNTESLSVAALAVAWEIAKASQMTANDMRKREDILKDITNAVIKAYKAIITDTPIDK